MHAQLVLAALEIGGGGVPAGNVAAGRRGEIARTCEVRFEPRRGRGGRICAACVFPRTGRALVGACPVSSDSPGIGLRAVVATLNAHAGPVPKYSRLAR